jgi:hypothetical protein
MLENRPRKMSFLLLISYFSRKTIDGMALSWYPWKCILREIFAKWGGKEAESGNL